MGDFCKREVLGRQKLAKDSEDTKQQVAFQTSHKYGSRKGQCNLYVYVQRSTNTEQQEALSQH